MEIALLCSWSIVVDFNDLHRRHIATYLTSFSSVSVLSLDIAFIWYYLR